MCIRDRCWRAGRRGSMVGFGVVGFDLIVYVLVLILVLSGRMGRNVLFRDVGKGV